MRCRRCARLRHPREFVGGPFGFCVRCLETHVEAMAMLHRKVPAHCQECGKTVGELSAETGLADIRMELHSKDGVMQLLCSDCGKTYAKKRMDLYGGTPYERNELLN